MIRKAVQTGTQAHVKLINYRKDSTVFLNMLSLRPLFDEDGGYRFMISISVEVSDAFSQMKPRLMQMDRLLKLLPEQLDLPSPPEVTTRIALVSVAVATHRRQYEALAEQEALNSENSAAAAAGAAVGAMAANALSGVARNTPAGSDIGRTRPKSARSPSAGPNVGGIQPTVARTPVERQRNDRRGGGEEEGSKEPLTPEQAQAKMDAAKKAAAKRVRERKEKMERDAIAAKEAAAAAAASPRMSIPRAAPKESPRLLSQRPASARSYVSPASKGAMVARRSGSSPERLPNVRKRGDKGSDRTVALIRSSVPQDGASAAFGGIGGFSPTPPSGSARARPRCAEHVAVVTGRRHANLSGGVWRKRRRWQPVRPW